jgi:ABC-type molybdate transport system substrate-binding protein
MASDVSIVHRFAPDAHDPIVYPLVQLNERPETVAFTDYLLSEQGLRAFVGFGFTPLVNEVAQ